MSEHSENLAGLVGDWELVFPETTPAVKSVLVVTGTDIPNKVVTFGYKVAPVPDPLKEFTLDKATKVLTLATKGGSKFPIDLSKVNANIKTITEVGKTIEFALTDGTKVVYTPTKLDPTKKADKTVKVVTGDKETLTITDPTLKDDITITAKTNTKNGLLKLDVKGELPASILAALKKSSHFLSLPAAAFDASKNTPPPLATDGDMVMVGKAGTLNVVPFGATTPTAHKVIAGDILRMSGGIWHIVSRSQTDSLPATKISTAAIGTPSLGNNVQVVLKALEDQKVPIKRKVISTDVNELRVNGLVEHKIDTDITLDLVTNSVNGIVKLDASGLIPISLLPVAAQEFHGTIKGDDLDGAANRPGTAVPPVPWRAGDTLQISVDGTANVFGLGAVASVTMPVKVGQTVIRDSLGRWVLSASAGSVNSGDVLISPMLGATHLSQLQLNPLLQYIEHNAVWTTLSQTVAGAKTFSDMTTLEKATLGPTGNDTVLPVARGTADSVLVTDGTTATWGSVKAKKVSFVVSPGITSTNVQDALKEVDDNALKMVPIKNQTLQGDAVGHHTILGTNAGVIMGDQITTNQIGGMIFSAGTF